MRLLLLGGTTEASRLAAALATRPAIAATLSLAGRTAVPAPAPIPTRVGGFGGVDGLATYLRDERIGLVVDATHPFATRISRNAITAARAAGVSLLAFSRPAWAPGSGDLWTVVPDIAGAVAYLEALPPRSVWLTTGRLDLAAFRAAPQHRYLVRTVDPPAPGAVPLGATVVFGRGPFDPAAERALLAAHAIDLLVTKNSGGAASEAKLAAAREARVAVLMVARPLLPPRPERHALADVLAAIDRHAPAPR